MKIKIVGEEKHKIKKRHPPKSVFFKYQPGETHKYELTSFLQERYPNIDLLNDLRHPESSVAMEELKKKDWVEKRELKKSGKDQPVESSNERLHSFEEEKPVSVRRVSDLDFYISDYAFDKLYRHCADIAQKELEAMGFMIGELREHNDTVISVVHDAITSNLESTSVSVRFHRDAFEHLFDQLDEIPYNYVIIGWYHSHPGFSSFMSQVDIDTQNRMFNKLFHAALVVDPVNYEVKSFRMQDRICVEIPYAVFSEFKQKKEKIPVETVVIKCPSCKEQFNLRCSNRYEKVVCPHCGFVFNKNFKI